MGADRAVARGCRAVRRGSGRTAVEGVMVGRAGGTRAGDVAASAAGQSAWFVVRSEEDALLVGVAAQSAAARLGGQSGAAGLGAAEAEAWTEKQKAVVGSARFAVGYLAPTGLEATGALAAVCTGNGFVVRLDLGRRVHAAERFEAEGLARSAG